MPLAGYPGLLAGFGPPFLNVSPQVTTGKMFFVSSVTGLANNVGDDPLRPLATWQQAYNKCRANKGDHIILMPNHAETITAAGGLTTTVAGVTTIGMGVGANRPEITFSTVAGASILINAVDTKIYNVIGISGVDQLTGPIDVEASGCYLDMEWQDPSSSFQAVRPVAVAATAIVNNFDIKLRVLGVTSGGTPPINGVRIGGTATNGVTGILQLDFYGRASTAVVEFVTLASVDIQVRGTLYNSGVTDGSKNVVDTITASTWMVNIFDAAAGQTFSGGSGAAAGVGGTSLVVPAANATTNILERDVIGNKTDTLIDVVGTTKSLVAYVKGALANLSGSAGVATYPTAAAYGNAVSIAAVAGYIQDGVRRGTGTILPANQSLWDVLGSGSAVFTNPSAAAPANNVGVLQVLGELFAQSDRSIQTTAIALPATTTVTAFTIAGGPIVVLELFALVITVFQAAATTIQFSTTPTVPGATPVAVSIASASLTGAAAGTSLMVTGTFGGAPTVTTNGTVAAGTTKFVVPAGVLTYIVGGATNTGTIQFFLRYRALARGVTVTAAF